MKKLIISIICLFIFVPSIAFAEFQFKPFQNWDKLEKGLFISFSAFTIADYLQTDQIIDSPNHFELNPVINCFGKKGLAPIFIGYTLTTYFIADKLTDHRKTFLGIMNLIQIGSVANNYYIGIKIKL